MSDTPTATPAVASVEIHDLVSALDRGADLVLIDVRNADEFRDWKIEARRPIETIHVPYFEFLEDSEGSTARVPRGRPVVVLCAQGGSSEMVADMLGQAGIPARNVRGGMIAYGEYLQATRVPLDPEEAARFAIWQVNRRGKGCLSYVVHSGDEAVVVDPARNVEWYETFVSALGARIVHVLDTHIHADHVSGGPRLAVRLGVPYSVKAGDEFELRQAITPLTDGQILKVGGDGGVTVEVRTMHTPGHTPGSISYLVGGRCLLTGDTVFVTSVGRPDLGGHVVEWGTVLFDTLSRRVQSMPDDLVILPAHFAGSHEINDAGIVAGRLGDLRRTVPELQMTNVDEFVAAVRAAVKEPPAAYADIIRFNLGLTTAEPEKISEWEIGKNQCAAAVHKTVSRGADPLIADS